MLLQVTVNINHEKKVFKKEQIQQVDFMQIVTSSCIDFIPYFQETVFFQHLLTIHRALT